MRAGPSATSRNSRVSTRLICSRTYTRPRNGRTASSGPSARRDPASFAIAPLACPAGLFRPRTTTDPGTDDARPVLPDRRHDRRPGNLWCPCNDHLWDDGYPWPLDPDTLEHACPFCGPNAPPPNVGDDACVNDHAIDVVVAYCQQRDDLPLPDPDLSCPGRDEFARALARRLPAGVVLSVDQWAGWRDAQGPDDPEFDAPTYVVAWNPADGETYGESTRYEDAVCDLAAAPLAAQVDYVLDQLLNG